MKPLQMVPIEGRECGPCKACCTVVGVEELAKPMRQPCQYECEAGCGIYEQRPGSCQTYSCMWLNGTLAGDTRRRPDVLGMIFDLRENNLGINIICAWEVWEGAAEQPAVQFLMAKMSLMVAVLLRRFDGQRGSLRGPPKDVERVVEAIHKRRLVL